MAEHSDFETRFRAAVKSLGGSKPAPPPYEEEEAGIEVLESDDGDPEKIAQVKPPTPINLFQHPEAHPVVLDLALLKKYGPEWLDWEIETLHWRVPQDFRTSAVSGEVFNWCTQPFNYIYVDFEILQPPSTGQMMVSIDTSKQVRSDVEWSDEVKDFMRVACRFDGIFCPPSPLDFIGIGTEHGLLNCAKIRELWPEVRKADQMPTEQTAEAEQLRRNLEVHRFVEANRLRLQSQLPLVLHA
jgi:hypothetical protein